MTAETGQRSARLWAAGSVIGALLASSCCIVPLVLIMLGVSGAWVGSLRAFEPYNTVIVAVTLVFLVGGFWHVYFRPKQICADGSYCARPEASRLTKLALWSGSVLIFTAITMRWWAPLLY